MKTWRIQIFLLMTCLLASFLSCKPDLTNKSSGAASQQEQEITLPDQSLDNEEEICSGIEAHLP